MLGDGSFLLYPSRIFCSPQYRFDLSGSWVRTPFILFRLSGSKILGFFEAHCCEWLHHMWRKWQRIACSSFAGLLVCLGLFLWLVIGAFAHCSSKIISIGTSPYLIRLDLKLISFMISPHWLDLRSSECRRNCGYQTISAILSGQLELRLWEIFEYEVKHALTRQNHVLVRLQLHRFRRPGRYPSF